MWKDPIENLIHLYEDGAFSRRDIIARLTKVTGSAAAALAALESAGLAEVALNTCPAGASVPESDPSLINQSLTISGEGGPLYIYQSLPADIGQGPKPAVMVVHENRGLTDYIKDVNRRVAKAGFVSVAVDLLSRQGGTQAFPDPADALAAYNRTQLPERLADMMSTLLTIRDQVYVKGDRLGVVGFCAGGGNVLALATKTNIVAAAAVYYGTPMPAAEQLANITAPMISFWGELDRAVTGAVPQLITALQGDTNKRYSMHIYPDVRHAFHNDTGTNYNAGAACDAWSKTIAWFNEFLNT
jgi:carboxymethylenebutenolidase